MFVTAPGVFFEHSRPDGALQKVWRFDDIHSDFIGNRSTDLGAWISVSSKDAGNLRESGCCWMLPKTILRYSAGVPLWTISPRVVITTHLGEILLFEQNRRFSLAVLSSFLDGLRAVRQRFERELEEGRRTCKTAEMRVTNIRNCRSSMNANSDRVVNAHMKFLPARWKICSGAGLLRDSISPAVLRLTTSDGRLVDSRDETNVAVLGDLWQLKISFRHDATVEAEWEDRSAGRHISPTASRLSYCTKAFGHDNGVNRIQYVRDVDSHIDAIQTCEVLTSTAVGGRGIHRILDADGTAGRWLVFQERGDVSIYDTETRQMAFLRTPSPPKGVMQTFEGLWMWGMDRYNSDGWSKLFTVDALESLVYTDPYTIVKQTEVVQRRVLDRALDAEAFGGMLRNKNRHPGHYWVVAGYGDVPKRLRAPDHIYKELARAADLRSHFWVCLDEVWSVIESDTVPLSAVWVGAIEVRDGVTAESIKEDPPETDLWRVGMSIKRREISKHNGEFCVTGNTLSTLSSSISFEVPVTAGRWLWRLEGDHSGMKLTLWHESVSDGDNAIFTRVVRPLDPPAFERRVAQLRVLAGLIPEKGLRAKIAQFSGSVYAAGPIPRSLMLVDKDVLGKQKEWYAFKNYKEVQVIPLSRGVALCCGNRCPNLSVGENVIRLSPL